MSSDEDDTVDDSWIFDQLPDTPSKDTSKADALPTPSASNGVANVLPNPQRESQPEAPKIDTSRISQLLQMIKTPATSSVPPPTATQPSNREKELESELAKVKAELSTIRPQCASNVHKVVIAARREIKALKHDNKQLEQRLDASGVVSCPECSHRFKESECISRPKYIRVFKGRFCVELDFHNMEEVEQWLNMNRLHINADGLPTVPKPDVSSLKSLAAVHSEIPRMVAEKEKEKKREEDDRTVVEERRERQGHEMRTHQHRRQEEHRRPERDPRQLDQSRSRDYGRTRHDDRPPSLMSQREPAINTLQQPRCSSRSEKRDDPRPRSHLSDPSINVQFRPASQKRDDPRPHTSQIHDTHREPPMNVVPPERRPISERVERGRGDSGRDVLPPPLRHQVSHASRQPREEIVRQFREDMKRMQAGEDPSIPSNDMRSDQQIEVADTKKESRYTALSVERPVEKEQRTRPEEKEKRVDEAATKERRDDCCKERAAVSDRPRSREEPKEDKRETVREEKRERRHHDEQKPLHDTARKERRDWSKERRDETTRPSSGQERRERAREEEREDGEKGHTLVQKEKKETTPVKKQKEKSVETHRERHHKKSPEHHRESRRMEGEKRDGSVRRESKERSEKTPREEERKTGVQKTDRREATPIGQDRGESAQRIAEKKRLDDRGEERRQEQGSRPAERRREEEQSKKNASLREKMAAMREKRRMAGDSPAKTDRETEKKDGQREKEEMRLEGGRGVDMEEKRRLLEERRERGRREEEERRQPARQQKLDRPREGGRRAVLEVLEGGLAPCPLDRDSLPGSSYRKRKASPIRGPSPQQLRRSPRKNSTSSHHAESSGCRERSMEARPVKRKPDRFAELGRKTGYRNREEERGVEQAGDRKREQEQRRRSPRLSPRKKPGQSAKKNDKVDLEDGEVSD